ncbi:MAG: hypothetical protein COB66_07195 [Coxiella sp. (in: Bacteria)]|nr:MAG: hypothetical protein COB66_07195 [Coxiella sp. (in: g-proteobacteria)]
MDHTDSFTPNNELKATIVSAIQISDQLGKSTGSLKSIGPVTESRRVGQAKIGIFPNIGNGNLHIEDHKVTVADGNFKQEVGLVFNSQGTPQWRVNIGRRVKTTSPNTITLTLDDGAEVLFSSTDSVNFTAQTVLGNYELTHNSDDCFKLTHPERGTASINEARS